MSDLPEQASVGNEYTTSSTNYTMYIELNLGVNK